VLSPEDSHAQQQHVEFCPVDMVSAAIVAISSNIQYSRLDSTTLPSVIFQHLNPTSGLLSYAQIMRGICRFAELHRHQLQQSIEVVDGPVWLERLRSMPTECSMFPVRDMFLAILPGVSYHDSNTVARHVCDFVTDHKLQATVPTSLTVTEDSIPKMLEYLLVGVNNAPQQ
jgi:hypothetical protein